MPGIEPEGESGANFGEDLDCRQVDEAALLLFRVFDPHGKVNFQELRRDFPPNTEQILNATNA